MYTYSETALEPWTEYILWKKWTFLWLISEVSCLIWQKGLRSLCGHDHFNNFDWRWGAYKPAGLVESFIIVPYSYFKASGEEIWIRASGSNMMDGRTERQRSGRVRVRVRALVNRACSQCQIGHPRTGSAKKGGGRTGNVSRHQP